MQTCVRVGELTPNPRFLQGYGALRLGLDLPSPAPYIKPRRSAPLTGAGASAFPRTPLAAGCKEKVSWLPPTFKVRAPAFVARCTGDFTRGLLLALRSLNPREHLGGFRAALQPRRGILRCRYFASARGTKSLPCGLRARGRPARNMRVQAETDRDRFCVSTNGCEQTNTAANRCLQTNFARD